MDKIYRIWMVPFSIITILLIMSIASSGFVMSGAGQFTSDYEIDPGVGRDIEVRIVANQIGNYTVEGRVIYYFEDDVENAEDYTLRLPIRVRSVGVEPTIATSTPKPTSDGHGIIPGLPGFTAVIMLIVVMIVTVLIRGRKKQRRDQW